MDLPAARRVRKSSSSSGEDDGKDIASVESGDTANASEDNRSVTHKGAGKRKRSVGEKKPLGRVAEKAPIRASRRTLLSRKVIEDDDDDADDEEEDGEDDEDSEPSPSKSPSPSTRTRGRKARAKVSNSDGSDSSSLPRAKRSKRSQGTGTTSDSASKDGDAGTDGIDTGMEDVVAGQNDILAQLEKEIENDDDLDVFDSDSEIEKLNSKRPERLTRRQRAMQGEEVNLEYTKLESPKSKKKPSEEEWSHDEEIELKRQQKARLRQMINEKRNKEKRAAMVDKVLRGVTSKRKKFTMASEARAAQVGTRLSQNEMREGCIRFISNKEGISISLPREIEEPVVLQTSVKAAYPPICKRDPRTGKRILTEG